MLPARARLRSSRDFREVVRRGRRAARGAVVVHAVLHRADDGVEPTEDFRAGFVVSRGVGGAVVRNLVRRRLRHALLEHRTEIAPGTDLVVRAQPSAAGRSYAELGADLSMALRRLMPATVTGAPAVAGANSDAGRSS